MGLSVEGTRGGQESSAADLRTVWAAPAWPPGAVAVEYETDAAAVVGAAGAWTYGDSSIDTSAGVGAYAPVAGIAAVGVHDVTSGALLVEQTLLGGGQTSSGTVDLSGYLTGADGVLTLQTYLRKSGTFVAADEGWGYHDSGDDKQTAGTRLGGTFGLTVTYTLRPPRHRFVFERARVAPPTRLFPRDDGLRLSSAARIWPPPKSRQRSNRSGPGSYE